MILASIVIFLLLEIFVFLQIDALWGFWPTVGAIFFTAFFGCLIARQQGLAVIRETQQEIKLGYAPAENLMVGACLLFAAMLLLIPGFVTDLIGLLLLMPIFRQPVISIIKNKALRGAAQIITVPGCPETPIIDGVFNDVTNKQGSEIDETCILPPKD